ncbi:S8 family serine peptidase [Candidatus Woesearchaeota archaeon]|nr:S8 family serine peptidase [Candidatus Woesearchaeota archaeon]
MMKFLGMILLIFLVFNVSAMAVPSNVVYDSVEEKILNEGNARVIVKVLEHKPEKKKSSKFGVSLASNEASNVQNLPIINGFSGVLTIDGLKKLEDSGLKYEIFEDTMIQLTPIKSEYEVALTTSRDSVGASIVESNYNITGRGVKVAVIDTGIDYTHESLGACNPRQINYTGTPIFLNETDSELVNSTIAYDGLVVESGHPYTDNTSHEWNITMPGFENISVHFSLLELEGGYDYIYVYDGGGSLVANYTGNMTGVWSPHVSGNTTRIVLDSDSGVSKQGFIIDRVLNGTSSTIYNWSSCSKIKGGYDFFEGNEDPMDDHYHGTHVAGIVGGNGTITGIAKDAELYALKACDYGGACFTSAILSSLQWALDNNMDIASLSISSGINADLLNSNTGLSAVSQAVNTAASNGLIVVVAAGNTGPGVNTIGSPADAVSAISVGASSDYQNTDLSDDYVASFSARGPSAFGRLDPDLVAPGYLIYSTSIGNTYVTISGTSMATPHVSGAAALLLEEFGSLTPSQIRAMLMASSHNISGSVLEKGAGQLNVLNALNLNMYALANYTDPTSNVVSSDRWEFVVDRYGSNSVNLTIFNRNNYEINFTFAIDSFNDLVSGFDFNESDFSIPSLVIVPANSNITFQINYSVSDYFNAVPGTYAGILRMYGLGNNGSSSVSKNISFPIVTTMPISYDYTGNFTSSYSEYERPSDNISVDGDNIYFALTSNVDSLFNVSVSYSSYEPVFNISIFNSTGRFLSNDDSFNKTSINLSSSVTISDNVHWIQAYNYNTSTPFVFTLSVSDNISNSAPNIFNVTTLAGSDNLTFVRPNNVTLVLNFNDSDDDFVTVSINDSYYSNISGNGRNMSVFYRGTDESCFGNHSVLFTLVDEEANSVNYTANITVLSPVDYSPIFLSSSPWHGNVSVSEFQNQSFSVSVCDVNSYSLNYYWFLNGSNILNGSEYNFSGNSSYADYNLTLIVSNNFSNSSVGWNLSVVPNVAPIIHNVFNFSNGTDFVFNRSEIAYIRLNFSDANNDSVSSTINESDYSLVSSDNVSALFSLNTSATCLMNHSVVVNVSDEFGNYSLAEKNISILTDIDYPPIIYSYDGINNFVVNNGSSYVLNITVCDGNNRNMTIYWFVNESIISSSENDTSFNIVDSVLPMRNNNVTVIVSNGVSNVSHEWNIIRNNPVSYYTAEDIPNLSWDQGSSESDAFEIDDYFRDADGDSISYYLINGSSISMSISNNLVSFTSSSSYSGSREVYIRATDGYSNATSNIFTLTVNSVSSPGSTTSSSTNSPGSNLGSDDTSGVVEYSKLFTTASGTIELSEDYSSVAINNVKVSLNGERSNVRIGVKKLDGSEEPSYVSDFGFVKYQVLEIEHENLDDSDISDVKIGFKVPKTYVLTQSISRNDIVLYRYSDGKWKPLSTSYTGVSGDNYLFEADSPGLSTFIVGHEEKSVVSQSNNEISGDNQDSSKNSNSGFVSGSDNNSVNGTGLGSKGVLSGVVVVSYVVFGIFIVLGIFIVVKHHLQLVHDEKNSKLKSKDKKFKVQPRVKRDDFKHTKISIPGYSDTEKKSKKNNVNYVSSESSYVFDMRKKIADKLKEKSEFFKTRLKEGSKKTKDLIKSKKKDKYEHGRIKLD